MMLPSQWHKFKYMWTELSKSISTETIAYLIETYAMLEYLIAVHDLFIERLLNKKWNLIRNNIDKESKTLSEILYYFGSWNAERTDVATNEKLTAIQSSKYYIAYQTYENLLTLVRDCCWLCMVYSIQFRCREFFPALHWNQSSLEIFFSQI